MSWKVLLTVFTTIFLAEIGDKTQLAVLTLVASTKQPAAVFLGAVLALASVTALGVLGGEALTRVVPEIWLKRASAAAFVVIGVVMWVKGD